MVEMIGAGVGRECDDWVDFDLFGHQVTAHRVRDTVTQPTNLVDGKAVPVFHFGIVLDWNIWESLVKRLAELDTAFVIAPHIRFAGEAGEQGTFFIREPGGSAMEFKTFRDMGQLFAA